MIGTHSVYGKDIKSVSPDKVVLRNGDTIAFDKGNQALYLATNAGIAGWMKFGKNLLPNQKFSITGEYKKASGEDVKPKGEADKTKIVVAIIVAGGVLYYIGRKK